MSEQLGAIAREALPEGAIRRQAGELRQINSELQLEVNRLRSIEVRMFPSNNPVKTAECDTPPEPVRTDLEELQHQINCNRELVAQANALVNILVEL